MNTPQQQISIRSASDDDWPAIKELLAQCELPVDGARDHLGQFKVAVSQWGTVVATAGLEVYAPVGLLRSMAVRPEFRSHGIAHALLGEIVAEAKQRGLLNLFLLTTTASKYFARHGFVEQARALVPVELEASVEMRGACPASAVMMVRSLVV